jgi:hypothetical protein
MHDDDDHHHHGIHDRNQDAEGQELKCRYECQNWLILETRANTC